MTQVAVHRSIGHIRLTIGYGDIDINIRPKDFDQMGFTVEVNMPTIGKHSPHSALKRARDYLVAAELASIMDGVINATGEDDPITFSLAVAQVALPGRIQWL